MINIRRLDATDFEAFRTLRLQGLRECPSAFASSYEEEAAYPPSLFAQFITPSGADAVFGAFEGAALVGCAGLLRQKKPKLAHKAQLWGMYVAPAARRAGTGRRLVEALLGFARSVPGVRQVTLGVESENVAAKRLYESFGFRVFGTERDSICVDGVFHAEIHMVLHLGEES